MTDTVDKLKDLIGK